MTQQGTLTPLSAVAFSSGNRSRSTKPSQSPTFMRNCGSRRGGEVEVLEWVEKDGRLPPTVIEFTSNFVMGSGKLSSKEAFSGTHLVRDTRPLSGEAEAGNPHLVEGDGRTHSYAVEDVDFVLGMGGLPTRAVERHQIKEAETTFSGKEAENSDFLAGSGGVFTMEGLEVVDVDEEGGGMLRGERHKLANFVKIKGRLPTREEMGILGSNKRRGELTVGYLVDRISNLPVVKHVQVLDLYHHEDKPLTILQFNKLLLALVRDGELESAMTLFSELSSYSLSPDSWSSSIMIHCLCKRNEPDKAKCIVDDMMRNGFHPNAVAFTVLINCFCKKGRLQGAFEIFEIMNIIGCEPTIQTYNCLINGLCYVGRVEEAFQLLKKIKKSSKKPDIYTFTTVMDGFCKVCRIDEALELLEEAMDLGLKPTVVTFNALFNGFCKEGRPLEGVRLLKEMEERDCEPDLISYSTLLWGLLKWGNVLAALETYKEMREIGFQVDDRVMNTLLRGICRQSMIDKELLEEAEELSERILKMGHSLSPYTYCLMVQALANGGEVSKAFSHLLEMVKIGHSPRMMTYNVIIRVLCEEGRIDDALFVFILMIERGKIPSIFSCNRLLDEFNRQGRLFDACSVYAAALKQGVILHREPKIQR